MSSQATVRIFARIEAHLGEMRIQLYIIAVLSSLLLWGASYHAAEASYHAAQRVGVLPNLHIKHHVREAMHRVM